MSEASNVKTMGGLDFDFGENTCSLERLGR